VAKIGERLELKILREVSVGLILDGEELGEVLIPKQELPSSWDPEGSLEVFLYRDSEDRPVATSKVPKAMPGEFAALRVIDSGGVGAFLDWGLSKDLLLPFREQKGPPKKGSPVVVRVLVDEKSGRLVASQRISRFLVEKNVSYGEGEEVDVLLFGKTEMGYKAIVNGKHSGLLYGNEVFERLFYADQLKAYVKYVRPDGKVDLSLTPPGKDGVDGVVAQIESELEKRGGFWAINDKTPADEIYSELGISKKLFKKATGSLFKQRKIEFVDGGIRRLSP